MHHNVQPNSTKWKQCKLMIDLFSDKIKQTIPRLTPETQIFEWAMLINSIFFLSLSLAKFTLNEKWEWVCTAAPTKENDVVSCPMNKILVGPPWDTLHYVQASTRVSPTWREYPFTPAKIHREYRGLRAHRCNKQKFPPPLCPCLRRTICLILEQENQWRRHRHYSHRGT